MGFVVGMAPSLLEFQGFHGIGNSIGKIILVKETNLISNDRRMPRVLVEIDLSNVLLEKIEVRWDEGSFI